MESKSKKRPVAFLIIARNESTGFEYEYRTIHIQGFAPGLIEKAVLSGKPLEGCVWIKVPVRYKVITKATGQELWCRYDPAKHLFVTEDGCVEFNVRQLKSYEEFRDGDI